jgi:hypothetical protein
MVINIDHTSLKMAEICLLVSWLVGPKVLTNAQINDISITTVNWGQGKNKPSDTPRMSDS